MFNLPRRLFVIAMVSALGACSFMSPPDNLDLRLSRPSQQNTYVVAMRPLVEQIEVNQIHSWEIRVTNPAGAPVNNAQIAFDGGMPQHGHGLPTKPRVTAELGDGRYRLDGMKFSMTGWWEMKVQVQGGGGSDRVTFNLVLPSAVTKVSAL